VSPEFPDRAVRHRRSGARAPLPVRPCPASRCRLPARPGGPASPVAWPAASRPPAVGLRPVTVRPGPPRGRGRTGRRTG